MRASSCASTTTLRARSVNLSNIFRSSRGGESRRARLSPHTNPGRQIRKRDRPLRPSWVNNRCSSLVVPRTVPLAANGLVGRVVGLHDGRRQAAAVVHLVAVGARPLADLGDPVVGPAPAGPPLRGGTAAGATGGTDE